MAAFLAALYGPQYKKRSLRHADGFVTDGYGVCTFEELARALSDLLDFEHPLVHGSTTAASKPSAASGCPPTTDAATTWGSSGTVDVGLLAARPAVDCSRSRNGTPTGLQGRSWALVCQWPPETARRWPTDRSPS